MKRGTARLLVPAILALLAAGAAALTFLPGRGLFGGGTVIAQLQPVAPPVSLAAELVSSDFTQPVFVVAPTGDPRLFVVDQNGRVWIVENGAKRSEPFLDIRSLVTFQGERGLLGLAFHPAYAENGRFFVNYSDSAGNTTVAEYSASSDPNRAAPETARILLNIEDPAGNHNGGWLGFGPEGNLYISNGDGGGGGDPYGNGQNTQSLFAKILRIDVDGAAPYAVPADNPFARGGGAPETFVYGLRNPWRVAFDGDDIYIADVGQNAIEEINVITTADGGANLGWSVMEGSRCFRGSSCDQAGLVLPVYEYTHDSSGGCSVTGGYVYRGSALPELAGHYFFGDYCAGFVRSFRYTRNGIVDLVDWTGELGNLGQITSFGVDSAGELYVTSAGGSVFKIVRG